MKRARRKCASWSLARPTASGETPQAVERTDGLRGLMLLDRLDVEAIFLYEKHPSEFHRLRDALGSDAAADLLLHWREYFGLKRADTTDREILIAEIAHLTPTQKQLAARYPSALPLILADPPGVTEMVRRMAGDETAASDVALDAQLHRPGARGLEPAGRPEDISKSTGRSPSRHFGGMGSRASRSSDSTGRFSRH